MSGKCTKCKETTTHLDLEEDYCNLCYILDEIRVELLHALCKHVFGDCKVCGCTLESTEQTKDMLCGDIDCHHDSQRC